MSPSKVLVYMVGHFQVCFRLRVPRRLSPPMTSQDCCVGEPCANDAWQCRAKFPLVVDSSCRAEKRSTQSVRYSAGRAYVAYLRRFREPGKRHHRRARAAAGSWAWSWMDKARGHVVACIKNMPALLTSKGLLVKFRVLAKLKRRSWVPVVQDHKLEAEYGIRILPQAELEGPHVAFKAGISFSARC